MSTPCRSVNWSLNTQVLTPKATVVFSLPLELACSPSVRCCSPLEKEFVDGIRTSAPCAVQIPWWFGAVVKDGGGKIGKVFEITITLPFFQMETSNRNFGFAKTGFRFRKAQRKACGKRLVKTQLFLSRHQRPTLYFFFTVQHSDFYTHGDDILCCACVYLTGRAGEYAGGTRASLCAIVKQRKGKDVG